MTNRLSLEVLADLLCCRDSAAALAAAAIGFVYSLWPGRLCAARQQLPCVHQPGAPRQPVTAPAG